MVGFIETWPSCIHGPAQPGLGSLFAVVWLLALVSLGQKNLCLVGCIRRWAGLMNANGACLVAWAGLGVSTVWASR